MPKQVNLDLDKKRLDIIDKRRGDLSREEFLMKVLDENVKSSKKVDFSKLKYLNNPDNKELTSKDISKLIENFQIFANDIYDRLDRLERRISDHGGYLKTEAPEELEPIQDLESELEPEPEDTFEELDAEEPEEEYIFSDSDGEPVDLPNNVTFEPIDSEPEANFKDEPEPGLEGYAEYPEDDLYESEDPTFDDPTDDEFEYGCPFCSATIDEDATYCPHCGNKFDDAETPDSDEEFDAEYSKVEPLSVGYSDSGDYDPRPNYLRKTKSDKYAGYPGRYQPPPPAGERRTTVSGTDEDRLPGCAICGDELTFIKEYKRWYCYKCKKYAGTNIPPPRKRPIKGPPPSMEVERKPRAKPRSARPSRDPNWQPLKGYHRYKK